MLTMTHSQAVTQYFYELLHATKKTFMWTCENREKLSPARREALDAILALAED
jgi:hypothetical protein